MHGGGERARWDLATQQRFGVICPRTSSFECPQRVAVNLRVVRKSVHVRLTPALRLPTASPPRPPVPPAPACARLRPPAPA